MNFLCKFATLCLIREKYELVEIIFFAKFENYLF